MLLSQTMRRSEGQWRPECDREMSNETNYWPESPCSLVASLNRGQNQTEWSAACAALPLTDTY